MVGPGIVPNKEVIVSVSIEKRAYVPKQKRWDPEELLAELDNSCVTRAWLAHGALLRQIEPLLWNDLTAEYDSLKLEQIIRSRSESYSSEFQVFLTPWAEDERRHYVATREIYSRLYGEHRDVIAARVKCREANFAPLVPFLQDELKLLLLIAYDEIVAAIAYHRDLEFYSQLEIPGIVECIQNISSDESVHLNNLVRLIKRVHEARLDEVKAILWDIVNHDISRESYDGTFVLDHKLPYPLFPLTNAELVSKCAGRVLRLLTGEHRFD